MSDNSDLCTRCNEDNANRDSYFCANCERYATISRLCNLAPDDGEVFEPMTGFQVYAMNERIATSEPVTW